MIDSVSFNKNTRFTKKGNPYQVEKKGKYIGLGAGALLGVKNSFSALNAMKEITNMDYDEYVSTLKATEDNEWIKKIADMLASQDVKNVSDYFLNSKLLKGTIIAMAVATSAISLFIAGVIVDKGVSIYRARKADKNSQKTPNTVNEPEVKNKTTDTALRPDMIKAPFIKQ